MRKTKQTYFHLLKTSANLFNTQGYKATSLSDIIAATGYSKGAIYAHFGSKEGLEREALEYMVGDFISHLSSLIKEERDARGKLSVILDFFAGYAVNPRYDGGCPIVNASVEMDDLDSDLNLVVKKSMGLFYAAILQIVENGKVHGQIREDVDAAAFSSLLFSSTEGAIVIMRTTGVKQHLRDVIQYLRNEVERIMIQ